MFECLGEQNGDPATFPECLLSWASFFACFWCPCKWAIVIWHSFNLKLTNSKLLLRHVAEQTLFGWWICATMLRFRETAVTVALVNLLYDTYGVLLNYVGNYGTCANSWLLMLLGNAGSTFHMWLNDSLMNQLTNHNTELLGKKKAGFKETGTEMESFGQRVKRNAVAKYSKWEE